MKALVVWYFFFLKHQLNFPETKKITKQKVNKLGMQIKLFFQIFVTRKRAVQQNMNVNKYLI